ncbi:acyl transferase/acyl hydrolase/lysophospholipase [Nemania serpens]|nr:acyl transferase/acyl hydrolase/lysophospholipase [Nemania serpens]
MSNMNGPGTIPSSAFPPAGPADHNETFEPWVRKAALSLDGGGIRGYWSLLVLRQLMQAIKAEEEIRDREVRSSFHPCDEPLNVSQISQEPGTAFLPCHYFDYVAGTSTGALISILLSRFRMTVDDCLKEYETMAGSVFGHPKLIYSMKFGMGGNKFRRASFERAVKEVIERRAERRTEDYSEFLFQTEIDTCRGIVLATRVVKNHVAGLSFLFRSYTPFNEKSRKHALEPNNLLEGSKISLLKVVLAATAAPLYFGNYHCTLSAAQMQASARVPTRRGTDVFSAERNNGKRAEKRAEYEFEDAGFSVVNNPCGELEREIEHHHGQTNQILVSIGTARPQPRDRRNHLIRVIRKAFSVAGDPEVVHRTMQTSAAQHHYFRFNDVQGIDIEMDDWRPKSTGERTLEELKNRFNGWAIEPDVQRDLKNCARILVDLRRARMATPRWERFALVRFFECRVRRCPKDRDNKWLDKEDFRNHLTRDHQSGDYEGSLEDAVERCAREWEYNVRR